MMNAKDARRNSLSILENRIGSKKMEEIGLKISEAVNKGQFSIHFDCWFGYDIEKYFELNGYKVVELKVSKGYEVTW